MPALSDYSHEISAQESNCLFFVRIEFSEVLDIKSLLNDSERIT